MNFPVDFDSRLHEIIVTHLTEIPDFPQPGILFRDFSPLLSSGEPFQELIQGIAQHYRGRINAVAGLESRGFILSSPLAVELGVPMIMVRKAGKLPGHVVSESYDLEYGSATIQVQPETVQGFDNILVVDDLLATGGTAAASVKLLEKAGGHVCEIMVLMELKALNGRTHLGNTPFHSLVEL